MQKHSLVKALFGTGLFIGYLPVAPATFACAISAVIWYFLLPCKLIYALLGAALFCLGIVVSNGLSSQWGKDPRQIVIDEYAAFLLPLYFTPRKLIPFIAAFLLFRFFDIAKPYPIRKIEKLPGGWGIMLDDLAAAVATTIVLLILKTALRW
jgi:phosphatidylglycerophosphatase A